METLYSNGLLTLKIDVIFAEKQNDVSHGIGIFSYIN